MRHLLVTLLCFSFIIFSCCDEDEPCTNPRNSNCPNYDPCIDVKEADASFRIIDSIPGFDCNDGRGIINLVYEVDTIWSSKSLYFKANKPASSYEWKIGSDPTIHTEKEFKLSFGDEILGNVQVTLVMKINDQDNCLTSITKSDTLTKVIHFIQPNNETALVNGFFKGVNIDAPLDTFIIGIPASTPLDGLQNFPKGCSSQTIDFYFGYQGIIIPPLPNSCSTPCGVGLIQADKKTLVVDYSLENGTGGRTINKFIGTKIN